MSADDDLAVKPAQRTKPVRIDARIAQTRDLVFASTLDLLAEVGVRGITVERIAERSGVARSTIYRRWPDLSTLFLEAFEGIVRRPLPAPSGNLEVELEQYLHDYAERLNDPTYFAVLVALIEWGWRDRQFAVTQRDFFDERRSRAAGIVRAGLKAGRIRGDIDVRSAMRAIEAPFLYVRMIDNDAITEEDIARVLADLVDRFAPPRANDDPAGKTRRPRQTKAET